MLTITILSLCRNEGKPVPVYTHVAEPKVHVQRVTKTARQVIIAGLKAATLRIGKHANREQACINQQILLMTSRPVTLPYWHEIIPHNHITSAPAGCNLIHWGLRDNGF